MRKLLFFLYCIYLSNACVCHAENSISEINGKKLPENFPQAMTYHTLFRTISNEAFKKRVQELSPYPYILAPGTGDSRKVTFNNFPNKIYTIIASPGGIDTELSNKVWAGHWLYKAGTLVSKDISPMDNDIFLQNLKKVVPTPKQYKRHLAIQPRKDSKEIFSAMVLYSLDDKGKPDWTTAEQLRITSATDQKIRVIRGQFGTKPRSFKAGKTVAARHVLYWEGQMQLNLSLDCPRGGPGNLTAAEWYAQEVANRVNEKGIDGVEFDVSRWTFSNEKGSNLDVNNDLTVDNGFIDGINSFGLGSEVFYRKLRKLVGPNKIIQGDSDDAINGIRGMKYVNGIQMESFPFRNDFDRFSEAFLHLRHFLETVEGDAIPRLSYPYTKFKSDYFKKNNLNEKKSANNQFRIGLATATLVGMPHPFANKGDWFMLYDKNGNEFEALGAYFWDEYHGGNLNNWQWLGKPVSPLRQDLFSQKNKDLLLGVNWKWKVEQGFKADTQKGETYSAKISMIPNNILPQEVWFAVSLQSDSNNITLLPGNEYTLEFDARGDDTWNYKNDIIDRVARLVVISNLQEYKAKQPVSVLVDSNWRTYRITIIPDNGTKFSLKFGLSEQIGSTSIRNIKLYNGGSERWSREFENGMVLLNMTTEPWRYEVQKGLYRRLKGTEAPEVNNGDQISSEIVIQPRDALFLVKNTK